LAQVKQSRINQKAIIPDKSVYSVSEMNPTGGAINPNSAIMSYFQLGEFNYEDSTTLQCLMNLINEPVFSQLRSQEQLGYIVNSAFISKNKMLGAIIYIQSNQKGPEYLESRINAFIESQSKDKDGPFNQKQIDQIKASKIKGLNIEA